MLNLYLPLAGNSINILLLFGLGGAVGFLSGLFGVGGGFLMTPLLIMVGIPSTVAAASDSNQIVAASTSGTFAHYRLGNVDFKMGIYLLIGGVIGGTLGVQFIKILRAMGNADFVIKITYVIMLGVIGFWYKKETAIYANLKAFLVNRVGDFGFLLGIALVLVYFNSLDYNDVFNAAPRMSEVTIQL